MPCEKIGYSTRAQAIQALKRMNDGRRHKYNVYTCNDCGEFHVYTSSKKKTKYDRKKFKHLNKYPIKIQNYIHPKP